MSNLITEIYCSPDRPDDVEDVAIALFHAAKAAGQDTADSDTVDKPKYLALATALLGQIQILKPTLTGRYKVFVLRGSNQSAPVNPVYEPANYDDYPALENPSPE